MFDFAWSEIGLIAVVALVLIGPKDMPVAVKALAGFIRKARRMAGEFQVHVDEMMREADLKEVRDSINEIRNFDYKGHFERTVDPDRSLRDTFAKNPLEPDPVATTGVASETLHQPPESAPAPPPQSPPTWFVPAQDIVTAEATPMLGPLSPAQAQTGAAPSFIPPAQAAPPIQAAPTPSTSVTNA